MDPEQIGSWGWEDWSQAATDVIRRGVRSLVYGPVKKYFRETLGEAGQGLTDQQMVELMSAQADQAGRPGSLGTWGQSEPGTAVPMEMQQAGPKAPFRWGEFLNKPPWK